MAGKAITVVAIGVGAVVAWLGLVFVLSQLFAFPAMWAMWAGVGAVLLWVWVFLMGLGCRGHTTEEEKAGVV